LKENAQIPAILGTVKQLKESLGAISKKVEQDKATYEGKVKSVTESYKRELAEKNTELTEMRARAVKAQDLCESLRKEKKTVLENYAGKQARSLGITTREFLSVLKEGYSLEDVDITYRTLQGRQLIAPKMLTETIRIPAGNVAKPQVRQIDPLTQEIKNMFN